MSEEKNETTPPETKPAAAPAAYKPPKNIDIVDMQTQGEKVITFTRSFTVTHRSLEDGSVRTGTFTFERPTLKVIGQIGVMKARLNGGEVIDRGIDFMHEQMSYLYFTLTNAPDWWDPENEYDTDLLATVYEKARSIQDSFRRRVG